MTAVTLPPRDGPTSRYFNPRKSALSAPAIGATLGALRGVTGVVERFCAGAWRVAETHNVTVTRKLRLDIGRTLSGGSRFGKPES